MINSKNYIASLHKNLGNLKNDFRNHNLINLLASKVKGRMVLDIGCGSGSLLNILRSRGKEVFGIEPNEELISLSKRLYPGLNVLKGDAKDINKLRKKFDVVTMLDVLEHIKDDSAQIREVSKYINKKGQLVLVVPVCQFLYGERDRRSGHYRRYSKKKLIDKLVKNNFQVSYLRYWNMVGFPPYFFYEKILAREINIDKGLRAVGKKGVAKKIVSRFLDLWFKYIENNINFGFGLSLICIAEKN